MLDVRRASRPGAEKVNYASGSASCSTLDALDVDDSVSLQCVLVFLNQVAPLFASDSCKFLQYEHVQCTEYRQTILTGIACGSGSVDACTRPRAAFVI